MPSFSCLTQLPLLKYNYHAARSYTVPRTWRCSEAQHRIRVSRASNLTKRFEYKYGTSRAGRGEACKEGTPPPESELKKNKKKCHTRASRGKEQHTMPTTEMLFQGCNARWGASACLRHRSGDVRSPQGLLYLHVQQPTELDLSEPPCTTGNPTFA